MVAKQDPDAPSIRVRHTDGVLTVSLDRPDTLNALRRIDIDELTATLSTVSPDVRAIVFRGAGQRAFSAGVDIHEFLALSGTEGARDFITALRDMLARVRRATVPTICVIDGYCIGGAFELALACDVRIVTQRSSFGLPEIKLGIPSVLDAALLQQYVGLGTAREMVLTGDLYPATAPALSGLTSQLVQPDDLDQAVQDLVAKVAGHTPSVLAAQKRLFQLWQDTGLENAVDLSIGEFAGVFAAADTTDALAKYGAELGLRTEDA